MDPSAWAAYQAVSLLGQAWRETGRGDLRELATHLEQVEFDIAKGAPVGFDPVTHQLRGPLYLLAIQAGSPTVVVLGAFNGDGAVLVAP